MSFLWWPVLAVWMGLGLVIGLGFIALLGWCGFHLASDMLVGAAGRIWCPVHRTAMRVRGTPRGLNTGVPFVALWRCELWGNGPVKCAKACLGPRLATAQSFPV